jgi:pimeloyl-ACP methyl ester carboxylesterase
MKSEAKRKGGWLWRWTKRFLAALTALLLIIVIAGAIYQFVATRAGAQKYPPPGKLVDVGGFKMHLNCIGEGSPTVVLDNGLFFGSFGWNNVPQEIAKFTRVCTLDRAGIGWSEASPHPRTLNQVNKELHDLLTNAGERKPFVLAGHSIGGLYAQGYANNYPDDIAGMVLIDSSHAEQIIRFPEDPPPVALARLAKILAPIGVVRLLMGGSAEDARELRERRAMQSTTKHLYASADEILAIEEITRTLREKEMQLGDKPLFVLTKNLTTKLDAPEDRFRSDQVWDELQKDLASRSTKGKQIIAKKAGHIIQKDEPELVINTVREVIEAVRK